MLDIDGDRSVVRCDGVSRRDFLRVGALTTVGLSLPQLLALEAAAGPERKAKARNVLLVYLGGGLTHHDTFDPKPDAPAEIRGKYGVVATGLAGIRFSDKMERLARCTDLFALCRGQITGSDHHETATQWMLTGNYGFMQGGDFPAIGAIVAHELSPRNTLPPYVAVPRNVSFTWELGKAAWLGERFESFKSGDCQSAGWKVPNLALLDGVDEKRLGRRQAMLQAIDSLARRVEGSDAVASMDQFQKRAAGMILSADARRAFDLSLESDAARAAYGGKDDRFGAQALLARRLLEGGVRFVLLNYSGWDHHANIFPECDKALPALDRTLAALLTDLKQRGLLDETLVAVYGEFGRTSKINKDSGRDHWGNAGVMLFAGAGVRGGQVIGATDARGEYVTDRAIRPSEVAATIYHALGIDFHKALVSPQGRPVPILPECEPVHELWA